MSVGYGRGYYGDGQLAQSAPRRRNWFTIAAVLGVGTAVVWLLWPRKEADFASNEYKELDKETLRPAPASPITINVNTASAHVPTFATPVGAFLKQLEDDALVRGLSVKDYEASVIASIKHLQAAGTQVVLPPHLQHLASQIGS